MQLLPHRAAVWLLTWVQSNGVHSSFRIISASVSLTRGRLFKDLGQHGNVKCIKKKTKNKLSAALVATVLFVHVETDFFFPMLFLFYCRESWLFHGSLILVPRTEYSSVLLFLPRCEEGPATESSNWTPAEVLTGSCLGRDEGNHPGTSSWVKQDGNKREEEEKNTERALAGIICKTSLFGASEGLQHVNSSRLNAKLPDTHRTLSFRLLALRNSQ